MQRSNRIDITDLETNTLLTARNENDVDYFHGRVAFSPDYKYFVDMGWIWHPVGSPVLYSVGEFLHEYENAYIELDFSGGQQIYCEDWDQRAVWLDNNTFEFNLELPEFFFDEEQEEKIVKEMGGHSGMSHFSVMDIQKKEDGRNLLKRRC